MKYKYFGLLVAFLFLMMQGVTAQTPDLSKMTEQEREGYLKQQEISKMTPAQQQEYLKKDALSKMTPAQQEQYLQTEALSKMTKAQQEEYIKQLSLKKIAGINSAVGQAKANNDQVLKKIQTYRIDYTKSLPVNKPGISVTNIPVSSQAYVITLAQNLLVLAQHDLTDVVLKGQLDRMLNDTSINVSGTAMLMLANGMPKFVGEYLICKDIIKHPSNPWSINDLAILYRNDLKYKESISAFQYALSLLHDSSLVIKTNLGWACSYYGDYRAAKKYFNEVLKIDPDFSSAMEGLAIIAYNEGDLGALFDCLMKEVTGLGGGDGGSGPSQEFSGLCGGIMDQNALATVGTDIDPTTDHTFDNVADDTPDQNPPTADDDEVKVPGMKFIFVNDAMDLTEFFGKLGSAQKTIQDGLQKCTDEPRQKMSTLPILKPIPYLDEHGDKVIPASYEKYVNLFHEESDLFMRKVYWYSKQYEKELSNFLMPLQASKADMVAQFGKDMGPCGTDTTCTNAVLCKWVPIVHSSTNSAIEAAGRIWNKYFDKILESSNSYIRNSSPLIKRVHTQQWNEYVNLLRQSNVRKAYLIMYGKWIFALIGIGDNIIMHMPYDVCTTELRLMSDASPDPYSKKLKPLKTFAGPCYTVPQSIPLGPIKIDNNCDKTKISISTEGIVPAPISIKLSFEKDYNRKFKDDDYFKLGVSMAAGTKISHSETSGGVKASGELELKGEVEAFWKFNNNHDMISRGTEASFEATATGAIETGAKPIDNLMKGSYGISGGVIVETICGQNAPDTRTVTYHIEKK